MKKIILIDDDHITNYVNKRILERELPGVQILEFTSGILAIDYLRVQSVYSDCDYLIFLDINMPIVSGWEVLERLDREFPEWQMDVVMLTSSIAQSDKEKALGYDRVKSFVSKPITRGKIIALIDKLGSKKSLLRSYKYKLA